MNINLPLILGLAFLHLYAGKLRWFDAIPKQRWLSFGGGVAIAYVFMEILPSLHEADEVIRQSALGAIAPSTLHVYLLALIGLSTFYGLETLVTQSHTRSLTQRGRTVIFWAHMGTFAIYNALFSYLLNHTARTLDCLLLFGAIALHYIVNDYKLREHHPSLYDKQGRWVLAAAVLAGWVISQLMLPGTSPDSLASTVGIAATKAFLAGGVILNVLNGELPHQPESCFGSFLLGSGIYTAILLGVE